MSRIGKKPVVLPKGVTLSVDGPLAQVKGPLGTLAQRLPPRVEVQIEAQQVLVVRRGDDRLSRAEHGLARSLLQNMVTGVSDGYTRVLVIEGVGYRAELKGQVLSFNVGYSNPVPYELPASISAELADRGARITLKGTDKALIGKVCAQLRAIRPPEPYKGKGIRLINEHVRRKAGKAGQGAK